MQRIWRPSQTPFLKSLLNLNIMPMHEEVMRKEAGVQVKQ